MPGDDQILRLKEVCKILRVHPTTMYKAARLGRIPSFRVGNEWRFRRDAILLWMTEKTRHSSQIRKVIHSGRNGGTLGLRDP
jgi:excisionase family DNA binding protein